MNMPISHPVKRLQVQPPSKPQQQQHNQGGMRAQNPSHAGGNPIGSEQWAFPGSVDTTTTSDSFPVAGSVMTPEQRERDDAIRQGHYVESPAPVEAEAAPQQTPQQQRAPQAEVPEHTERSKRTINDLYKGDAEMDADYYSVQLPSDFRFYDFKNLSVKKVTGRVQAKFTRAAVEQRLRYMVEGVSSLLGDGVSAFDISSQDFRWLQYWILLASYPISKRRIGVECTDEGHIERVLSGELPDHSLRFVAEYERPVMKEVTIDHEALDALDLSALNGRQLGVFTMNDSVYWDETYTANPAVAEKTGKVLVSSEDEFIHDLAVYLKGGTFEERVKVIEEMSVPEFKALEAYRAVAAKHGVYAYYTCKCKECGADIETPVSVSASDFL